MTNFLKSGIAAAVITTVMAATPALATDVAETAVATVEYRDLDLFTEQGQNRLERRLRRAAHYVCGMDIRDAASRFPSREAQLCFADKVSGFDRQIATLVEAEAGRG